MASANDLVQSLDDLPTPEVPAPSNGTAESHGLASWELTYFKKVLAGLSRASELEAQAQQALAQATALRGAYESFSAHLTEQYGLNPQYDQIDPESGAILHREAS